MTTLVACVATLGGGAIEIASFSLQQTTNVYVYEQQDRGFKRISEFVCAGSMRAFHLLYEGRAHYDLLLV